MASPAPSGDVTTCKCMFWCVALDGVCHGIFLKDESFLEAARTSRTNAYSAAKKKYSCPGVARYKTRAACSYLRMDRSQYRRFERASCQSKKSSGSKEKIVTYKYAWKHSILKMRKIFNIRLGCVIFASDVEMHLRTRIRRTTGNLDV
jgi:hypothetical protein